MGRTFVVRIRTENPDQASFCPFALRGVSVASELAFGHLRYRLTASGLLILDGASSGLGKRPNSSRVLVLGVAVKAR